MFLMVSNIHRLLLIERRNNRLNSDSKLFLRSLSSINALFCLKNYKCVIFLFIFTCHLPSYLPCILHFFIHFQGRIQDFQLGGAQKIMCPHAHYERKTEPTFGMGPGPLSSRVVLMCSRAIWALFLSILINKFDTKNIGDPIVAPPPPWIRHCHFIDCIVYRPCCVICL